MRTNTSTTEMNPVEFYESVAKSQASRRVSAAEKAVVPIFATTMNDEEVNAVDARELHRALGVRSRFNDWITNRIRDCGFNEGNDFLTVTKNLVSGGLAREYTLSLDSAKHIAMLERNRQGFRVRQYFIDFEKKARKVLRSAPHQENVETDVRVLLAKALKAADGIMHEQQAKIEEQAALIAEQKPKAEAYDTLLESEALFSFHQVTKMLRLKLSALKLTERLRRDDDEQAASVQRSSVPFSG